MGVDFDGDTPRFPAYGFDFNLVVNRGQPKQMVAFLKTEITKSSTLDELSKASGPLIKVKKTWVQVEGATSFNPVKTGIPGDNGLSSLSVYGDRIYRFTPDVKKEDGEAYLACPGALVEQWKSDAGK